MANFVSVKDNPLQYRSTNITKRDLFAILSVAPKYMSRIIDVDEAGRLLHMHGLISRNSFENIRTKVNSCKNKTEFSVFLVEILAFLSFDDLIRFLKIMRYYDFATDLWNRRYGNTVFVVSGADIGVSEDILTYYSRTKCYMDDNVFKDRKTELETRFNDLRASFSGFSDPEEKALATYKFAAVTFLRISQFRERCVRERILNEMRESVPSDVDRTFPDIVYYGKMANTAVFAGETALAKEYMQKAQLLAENCQQAFVKVFAHHDEQYIYRFLLSKSPGEENVKNAVVSGQLGLDVLQDLSDEKAMIWRKVFISENAMSLLKIKNTFDILYSEEVNEKDRRSAKELMRTLEHTTNGKERRREMVNCLCKARIHEVDNIRLAQEYANQARRFALEGSHFPADLVNITKYNIYLRDNTFMKHQGTSYME